MNLNGRYKKRFCFKGTIFFGDAEQKVVKRWESFFLN